MTDIIYFIRRENDGLIKIGTTSNLRSRFYRLQQEHGKLTLMGIISGGVVREKLLHWCFNADRVEKEFFEPTDELIGLIDQYARQPTERDYRLSSNGSGDLTTTQVADVLGVTRMTLYNKGWHEWQAQDIERHADTLVSEAMQKRAAILARLRDYLAVTAP